MDRVEEIEAAIRGLPPEDYERLAQWFHALEQTRWDEQMDRDSASGKLDFLFDDAERVALQPIFGDSHEVGIAHLQKANPQEWIRQFDDWVDSHDPNTPVLSDEAMSRESIYPDQV